METIPNEMVNDAIDRAAITHLLESMTYAAYFERKVRRIPHYAFTRFKACSRLCLRASASRQRSPEVCSHSAALVMRKSSGCALANSSQVSGIDIGAPA